MADIDGTPVLDGTTIYATSFKKRNHGDRRPDRPPDLGSAKTAAPAASATRPTAWSSPIRPAPCGRSTRPPAARCGQQPALARRKLTGVAVQGDYAVVGDFDGYVHWLRLSDGAFAARERVGGDAVRAAPVVADGVLLVQNTDGEVTAFRLQ